MTPTDSDPAQAPRLASTLNVPHFLGMKKNLQIFELKRDSEFNSKFQNECRMERNFKRLEEDWKKFGRRLEEI